MKPHPSKRSRDRDLPSGASRLGTNSTYVNDILETQKLGAPARQSTAVADRGSSRRLHRKQSATYLGVSLSWLDKSRLRGDGPAFLQIGTRVVYDTADLDHYLASRRRQSTSEQR